MFSIYYNPKPCFPPAPGLAQLWGQNSSGGRTSDSGRSTGAPLLARPRLCYSRVPYHQFCSSQDLGARPLGPQAPPGSSSISPFLEPPPGPIPPAASPCACRILTQSLLAALGRDCDLQAFSLPRARPVAAYPGQFRGPLGSWFWSQAAAGSLCGLRQVAAPLCAE